MVFEMKMIDIHCHILPKVDDGPDTVAVSKKILENAYKQGVRHMIVTPHYRPEMFEPSMERVLYSYQYLRDIARDMGITMSLGCEYYRNTNMLDDLKNHRRPTMANSKYVLVEFSSNDAFLNIRNYIYELDSLGYKPIIAHVERYNSCREVEKVAELKDIGAYIQMNAGSVLGEDGRNTKKLCYQLMKNDLVDFVASDTHNITTRKMNLKNVHHIYPEKWEESMQDGFL